MREYSELDDDDLEWECPHCHTDCAEQDMLAGGERVYSTCKTRLVEDKDRVATEAWPPRFEESVKARKK